MSTHDKNTGVAEPAQNDAIDAERARILTEYKRRAADTQQAERYASWQPAEMFMRNERRRIAGYLLKSADALPRSGDACLEIGYGSLGWLADLITWGVREADLHGIELDANRAAIAQEALPTADLRVGDAGSLPWNDGTFRVVVVSTVFTSILNAELQQRIANEITRVLAPGGALLWYDFAVNNPRNPQVKAVTRSQLSDLFPQLSGVIRSITLAPPLARLLAPRSWALATVCEAIPLLRTHLLAVLKKS